MSENKQYTALWLILLVGCVMDLTGCAGMELLTEQDKMNAIVIPDGVTVEVHEWRHSYPGFISRFNAYADLSNNKIYTLKDNACLLEHEVKHFTDGLGHEGWPERLLRCMS